MRCLDASSTALLLVDLQYGTLTMPLRPHSAAHIVKNATALGRRFEEIGAMIVLTHVAFPWADNPDRDSGATPSMTRETVPPGWSEFTPAVRSLRADIILGKRKWNAFQGTDLDRQLRRRRITTLVIAGATTHIAVEFTARDACQRDYSVIIAEDAVASIDPEFHRFSMEKVFPRIATVCATAEILAACSTSTFSNRNGLPVREPVSACATKRRRSESNRRMEVAVLRSSQKYSLDCAQNVIPSVSGK
jgi:nicotinamidase-related amidase